jgi:hypothetical protein
MQVLVIGFIKGRWYGFDQCDRRPVRFQMPACDPVCTHEMLVQRLIDEPNEVLVNVPLDFLV